MFGAASGFDDAGAIRLPPGPRTYQLPGLLPRMVSDPLGLFTKLLRRYGDVVRLNLGPTDICLIGSPEHAHYVLKEHADNFQKSGTVWERVGLMFGRGLVAVEGSFWRKQRRMLQPQFSRQQIHSLIPLMASAIDEELARWSPLAERRAALDVYRGMAHVTMNVLLRTMFGTTIDDAQMDSIHVNVAVAIRTLGLRILLNAFPEWLPLPGDRRFRAAVEAIDRTVLGIIEERRRSDGRPDLLDLLLCARDEAGGSGMDDQQLRDEVIALLVGGHETTASALAWAFYLLCRHPEAARKLRAEVEEVLGGRPPEAEDLSRLPFTRNVIQESLRLYSPAWMTFRTTQKEDAIGGHRIPKGAVVVVVYHAIHRDPAHWDDPLAFVPERFLPERFTKKQRDAYLPFGTGGHQCIGNHFALVETALTLAMVTQRYRMELVSDREVKPLAHTTLQPQEEIRVTLHPA